MSKATHYIVTTPVEGKDGKTRFTQVGVAFPGKEGQKPVMNIRLDAFPANGELVLFEPNKKDDSDDQVTE